jgi:parallel beta-helix repeat protein
VLYITGAVSPTVEGLGLCCGNAGRQGGYQAGIDVDAGGGVYIITATATLSNCEISGQADFGGGVFAYHSRAALSGNTIRYSNAGWRGGGVYLAETYNARLSANKIVNNKVFIGEGGGVAIQGGSATLSNNLIANNQSKLPYGNDLQSIQGGVATYGGGGVFVGEGDVTLSGNTIVSNTAQEKGGGIFLWESGAILQNNVVADNHAGTGGNGLAIVHNPTPGIFPRLWHNTIARNTGGDGSGLYLGGSYAGVQYSGAVAMTNTILVSHTVGISVTGSSAVTVDSVLWHSTPVTVSQSPTATVTVRNQHTGDPAFAADGYHLTAGSAAIDKGLDAGMGTDIDGDARPDGCFPDLGADEFIKGVACRRIFLPLVLRRSLSYHRSSSGASEP